MNSITQDQEIDTSFYIHKGKFRVLIYFDVHLEKSIFIAFSEGRIPSACYMDELFKDVMNTMTIPWYWEKLSESERQGILSYLNEKQGETHD